MCVCVCVCVCVRVCVLVRERVCACIHFWTTSMCFQCLSFICVDSFVSSRNYVPGDVVLLDNGGGSGPLERPKRQGHFALSSTAGDVSQLGVLKGKLRVA